MIVVVVLEGAPKPENADSFMRNRHYWNRSVQYRTDWGNEQITSTRTIVIFVVVGRGRDWGVMTLPRRELQNEQKWPPRLGETRMQRSPRPTIIVYIEYIIYLTITITVISLRRRREYTPARGHTTDWDLTPTSWEECTSSQRVARHLPNPAIPPYSIQTPHCMEPRRWRIHIYALAGFFWKVP